MAAARVPLPAFDDVSDGRRRIMAAIRGQNTAPEMLVRRLLHRMGYRYRLHARDLPGRPDIVLPRHRTVIEVRGCYWHRHSGCRRATTPRTRQAYWEAKFARTVERDRHNLAALEVDGWSVLVLWECELADPALERRLRVFLGGIVDTSAELP